uniref:TLDc domain-containing protein n=1 Tax=Strongyloides venezuelensis TaxID=75913 RepID=A0A0K0G1L7_STRVS
MIGAKAFTSDGSNHDKFRGFMRNYGGFRSLKVIMEDSKNSEVQKYFIPNSWFSYGFHGCEFENHEQKQRIPKVSKFYLGFGGFIRDSWVENF